MFGQIRADLRALQHGIKYTAIKHLKISSSRAEAEIGAELVGFSGRVDEAVELDSSPTL